MGADGKSVLIDNDLAELEGTLYPGVYNPDLVERHPHARPHWPMRKDHDRFSLAFILEQFFPNSDTATRSAKTLKNTTPLSDIAADLEACHDSP